MKLPWVSREQYDRILAALNDTTRLHNDAVAGHHRSEQAWSERYDALLEKYQHLADPPQPVRAQAQTERAVSLVTQAIRDEANGDPRLAAWLRKRAEELRRSDTKLSDEEIAAELRTWQTTESEGVN